MLFLKSKNIWIFLMLWAFISACGYQFAGGGNFPAGVTSLSINMFENRTAETGVENVFTNDIIYEVTRDKKVVLRSKNAADATPYRSYRFHADRYNHAQRRVHLT